MKLLALTLHKNRTVAPVDDNGRHFEAVEVYRIQDDGTHEKVDIPFDPEAEDFDLGEALTIAKVTDLIGQHFEDECFANLHARDLHLWLEAPELGVDEAVEAFKAGKLPEAKKGTHVVHGPEGKRTRHEGVREHHGRHRPPGGSRGVNPPAHGPSI
jgi:hypothetical protein